MHVNFLKTRPALRKAVAGATAALLIAVTAGCGATSTTDSEAGNKDVAIGGQRFSTADEETAKFGADVQEDGVFPRTVTHARGETTIKEEPKRIVVLDTGELDQVLALGVTPVGMVSSDSADAVPAYLGDKVDGIENVGTINELNLEAIAALKPDLILGSQLRADKMYDKLAEIAPTIFSVRPGYPWKENTLLVGAAMGKRQVAVDLLNEYQDKATALGEDVEGDPEISLLRFSAKWVRLYANLSLIGVIMNDVGLKRPANQDIDDLKTEISAENLTDADADWIFYSSYGDPQATGEQAAIDGPLWDKLEAVKEGHAIRVDDDVWFMGLGPIGAMQILDDLRENLVK